MQNHCPTRGRPRALAIRKQRQRLEAEIRQIEQEIQSIERGALLQTIKSQPAAPSCTICEQAPPGKPGQPTTAEDLTRPLRARRDTLIRDLIRLSPGRRSLYQGMVRLV